MDLNPDLGDLDMDMDLDLDLDLNFDLEPGKNLNAALDLERYRDRSYNYNYNYNNNDNEASEASSVAGGGGDGGNETETETEGSEAGDSWRFPLSSALASTSASASKLVPEQPDDFLLDGLSLGLGFSPYNLFSVNPNTSINSPFVSHAPSTDARKSSVAHRLTFAKPPSQLYPLSSGVPPVSMPISMPVSMKIPTSLSTNPKSKPLSDGFVTHKINGGRKRRTSAVQENTLLPSVKNTTASNPDYFLNLDFRDSSAFTFSSPRDDLSSMSDLFSSSNYGSDDEDDDEDDEENSHIPTKNQHRLNQQDRPEETNTIQTLLFDNRFQQIKRDAHHNSSHQSNANNFHSQLSLGSGPTFDFISSLEGVVDMVLRFLEQQQTLEFDSFYEQMNHNQNQQQMHHNNEQIFDIRSKSSVSYSQADSKLTDTTGATSSLKTVSSQNKNSNIISNSSAIASASDLFLSQWSANSSAFLASHRKIDSKLQELSESSAEKFLSDNNGNDLYLRVFESSEMGQGEQISENDLLDFQIQYPPITANNNTNVHSLMAELNWKNESGFGFGVENLLGFSDLENRAGVIGGLAGLIQNSSFGDLNGWFESTIGSLGGMNGLRLDDSVNQISSNLANSEIFGENGYQPILPINDVNRIDQTEMIPSATNAFSEFEILEARTEAIQETVVPEINSKKSKLVKPKKANPRKRPTSSREMSATPKPEPQSLVIPPEIELKNPEIFTSVTAKIARRAVRISIACLECSIAIGVLEFRGGNLDGTYTARVKCSNCEPTKVAEELTESIVGMTATMPTPAKPTVSRKRTTSKKIDNLVSSSSSGATQKSKNVNNSAAQILTCLACKQTTVQCFVTDGLFGVAVPATSTQVNVSLVCSACEAKYLFCAECGGGGKTRTGKYRPRELFPIGRKTCSLPHIRIGSATVLYHVLDVSDKAFGSDIGGSDDSYGCGNEFKQEQEILQEMHDVFFDALVSLYAVPSVLEGVEVFDGGSTCDSLTKIFEKVDGVWGRSVAAVIGNKSTGYTGGKVFATVAWIEKQYRMKSKAAAGKKKKDEEMDGGGTGTTKTIPWMAKLSNTIDSKKFSGVKAFQGNSSSSSALNGFGTAGEEKTFVSFAISEWDEENGTLFVIQMTPRSVHQPTVESYRDLLRETIRHIQSLPNYNSKTNPLKQIWTYTAKDSHPRLKNIPERLGFVSLEHHLKGLGQTKLNTQIFSRPKFAPLQEKTVEIFVAPISSFV
ncbi:hypothetical protein HK100_011360 [Physocladia obscura]|uniref:Uncharacterized protein n=1 Tax=Physocladia obscura TaxID=109957 RepID=A0AAD5T340_9FUNG|nr:hypothetical protein HK100_011360 [Physocladia obscura]